MERMVAARRSFWVVRILGVFSKWRWGEEGGIHILSYSHTAGRNFSWISQMLWHVRSGLERVLVLAMILRLGGANDGD